MPHSHDARELNALQTRQGLAYSWRVLHVRDTESHLPRTRLTRGTGGLCPSYLSQYA